MDLHTVWEMIKITNKYLDMLFEYKNKLWIYDPVWGTMLVGKATARSQYERMCTEFIEKCYKYKIKRSFVVDDWSVPAYQDKE